MSHFTTLKTVIKDINALKIAAKELGIELKENATARGWSGNSIQGDYVLKLKGPYDAALVKSVEGHYNLVADWFGGHVEREIGKKGGKLLQEYSVAAVKRAARKKGKTARVVRNKDGSVQVRVQA